MRRSALLELRPLSLLLLAMALFFTACKDDEENVPPDPAEAPTGTLTVGDQFISETGNMIMLDEVTLSAPGWVVAYRHEESVERPITTAMVTEPVHLAAGTHNSVALPLLEGEEIESGEQLWVMLHADTGQEGEFEFDDTEDGEDQPIVDEAGTDAAAIFVNQPTFTEDTEHTIYAINPVEGSGVSGTATFYRAAQGDGAYVVLDLEGTETGGDHPAHIHANSVEEGGGIVIPLENVEGETGRSVTFVNQFAGDSPENPGEEVTYDQLLSYDGHINVHESPENLANLIAAGDIGTNGAALTGRFEEFDLLDANREAVGTSRIMELEDGSFLVRLDVEGTEEGVTHPAQIRTGTVVEGGTGTTATLNPVTGSSGQSFTRVQALDDETAITFDELEDMDAYIGVQATEDDPETLAAGADIGSNVLTGETQVIDLAPAEGSEVSGTLTLSERRGGTTLADLDLENVGEGETLDAGIYEGAVGAGGERVITLNSAQGSATGLARSSTNIRAFDSSTGVMGGGDPVDFANLRTTERNVNITGADGASVAAGAVRNE